ncbi:MAG: 3TM-type holin [Minwuia sp.]|uniref:3TM-type holin n=1 Tax=Minwuia sp. TaxID=2493630 RepID=UPI003A8C7700
MSWLGDLIGGGVVTAAEGVAGIVDRFVETDDEKRVAEMLRTKMLMQPSLVQTELNKVEAGHRSVFVAGWRPFIGWVCGLALFYNFVARDLLAWAILNSGVQASMPPDLAMEELMTVLLGMLGLGAFRTAEKMTGRAR